MHRFRQVDVFSSEPLRGNPVAVVHDADDLSDDRMAAFARWTNLSETTFLLRPTDPAADYRLRIFTPGGELPFAGHPTLGSAYAWLEDGGVPASDGVVVQECAAGLVRLRRGDELAFAAPPLRRSGPADADTVSRIAAGLRIPATEILAAEWVDNGPGWVAARLRDADAVLALTPDFAGMGELNIGAVGPYPPGGEADVEVRAFCPDLAVPEDPVTGSLNAGLAQWLIGAGVLPARYVASQGTVLGRRGRVHVESADGEIWIGGATGTTITGNVALG
ncbi:MULTISPECIES: PhzF family phenazine biosynthesis protein [Tsukamurella]|uniref:PhzF family phenazine biosynthesis protein n=2 Tax=Tsukamurella TaxID=2060 RepID=A0A5C5S426_9ACTN|nr:MULTISPECIES: PhzF family phenazine biosynthesis protein [Tsukamurella]NMD57456.1 PhzF family phenazine biosynthesis protein [Tsukamurella columbiensis]TWS29969.1 PhzF family phenazine biosynthesis protein [Tsukamurella conjunctivitidis]